MRINFLAGAAAGKTTVAHWLFAELKTLGHSVEFARETIKKHTYMDIDPSTIDQEKIFAEQIEEEYIPLMGGVKNIVTECPIHLSHIYARMYRTDEMADEIFQACKLFDGLFDSVVIYLDRGNKPYKQEGRWGTVEDAKRVDEKVKEFIKEYYEPRNVPVLSTNWLERDRILEFALRHISR